MYCANCGVKLADTEKICPLCGALAYHPEIKREIAEPIYPSNRYPILKMTTMGKMMVVTALFLLPTIITFLVDFNITNKVTWSGIVMGAIGVFYISFVLPFWFRKPNPVIFTPCGFAAAILYLLYLDLSMKTAWFMSFALPVAVFAMLVSSAVVTLTYYLRKGHLYIFGGAFVLTGTFMPVMEYLMRITFKIPHKYWSFYPLVCLVLLGGLLLFFAICKPARESMEQKFFI